MSLIEMISKKTSFTVAVGFSMILWAGFASFFGLLCDYITMREQQMELFLTIISVVSIMAPICMTIQMLMLGLVKSFALKSLRPIIDNIDGIDISPKTTRQELDKTIAALKKFPEINAIIGFILCSVIILVLIGTVYFKGYEFFWVMTQVIFGTLAVIIYGVTTFLFTNAKTEPVRKNAYSILNEMKKSKMKN